jgi:hypothetical protein
MLSASFPIAAQTPSNFSGKWVFDKEKSSPGLLESGFDGTVTRQITQNSTTLSYADIYVRKGSDDWKTSEEPFNLDGKETIKKGSFSTIKKSAKWSEDKKSLTLTYIDTQVAKGVSEDFLTAESYKLTDGGLTLLIETYSKNPVKGESKTQKIYHKK